MEQKYLTVIAVYKSGREEIHRVKKIKGASNKELETLINALRNMPTVKSWRITDDTIARNKTT